MNHGWSRPLLIAVAAAAGLHAPALAQDAHYWTQQYGPRAGLLGGAIIGSAEDYSAAFYNPGALAFVDRPTLAVSAQVFERETLTLEEGGGPGVDLGTSRSGLQPSLIAGRLPFGGERHSWTYSVLTRQRVRTDVRSSLEASGTEIPPEFGVKKAIGTFRLENELRDSWGGVSWSYLASSKIGLGVTMFGSWRSQRRREEIVSQIEVDDGSTAARVDLAGYDYKVGRLLWKVGLQWDPSPALRLGLNLTTPAVNLIGNSEVGVSRGRFGFGPDDSLEGSIEETSDATYKSPLSVGLGGAYRFGDTRIHGSAEWFDAIDEYAVASSPASGMGTDTLDLAVVHAARSVVNWGLGVEHRFNAKVGGYVSFVVDRSSTPKDRSPEQNTGTAPWDTHIGTIGADFEVGTVSMTLGIGIGVGDSPFAEALDFLDPGNEGLGEETTLRYRVWRFIFGFEL
jgi:hypothetical protein